MGKRPSAIVLTDEEKTSYKFDNRSLYQKARSGEFIGTFKKLQFFRTYMIRRRSETKRRNGAKAKQRT